MSPYLHYSRIAFTALCGLACVLLIVLWVRSYSRWDVVRPLTVDTRYLQIDSSLGSLEINFHKIEDRKYVVDSRRYVSIPIGPEGLMRPNVWYFDIGISPPDYRFAFPHWFAIALTTAFAAFPWLPWRFSLRTLLIATTAIALILGLVFAMNR